MTNRWPILVLYIILTAGGLWHILGWFQTTMRVMASPLLIVLAGISIISVWSRIRSEQQNHQQKGRRFLQWSLLVILGGFAVETIGVKTGWIFGDYVYGSTLVPNVFGVPVAIGFAWILITVSATAIAYRLKCFQRHALIGIVAAAMLMVLFDMFMEPAAVALNYWNWQGSDIPLSNYIAWFVLGGIFIAIGNIRDVFPEQMPWFLVHLYIAQLIYFLLIYAKPDS